MGCLVTVTDAAGAHGVTFTLDDAWAQRPAADFVFDVLGAPPPPGMGSEEAFSLKALQALAFDRDDEGFFIRDGVSFSAQGREVDPDATLARALGPGIAGGQRGYAGEIRIQIPQGATEEPMAAFGRMGLVHFVSVGKPLDVTRDYPDLAPLLERVEAESLLAIDVPTASYRLTPKGEALHGDWLREAQDLVKRYDIYGDVDEDASGTVRFDTGLGADLRVAVFEHEGHDPFRARFLLGLNDGEWDALPDWVDRLTDTAWYDEIFSPIESAPGAADVGAARLGRILSAGKAALREDGVFERDR